MLKKKQNQKNDNEFVYSPPISHLSPKFLLPAELTQRERVNMPDVGAGDLP